MDKILKFIKKNKNLCIWLIIAIVIYISYEVSYDWTEIFPKAGLFYNLASQLSIAYMGSFIFYIIQVYIPELEREKNIYKNIYSNIEIILSNINPTIGYFLGIGELALDIDGSYQFENLVDDFSIDEEITNRGDTSIEYISRYIDICDKHIDNVYNLMIIYTDYRLLNILDRIRKSNFHGMFVYTTKVDDQEFFEENLLDCHIEEYFNLYRELYGYLDEECSMKLKKGSFLCSKTVNKR